MLHLFPSAASWRRVAYRVLTSACTALTTGCVDLRPPVPETAYRAAVSVEASPASAHASAVRLEFIEFYQEGKWRRESDAAEGKPVLIDRPDLRVSWLLDTNKKLFDERHISEMDERFPWLINPFGPRAKADFELIGTEDIAGTPAKKYDVRGKRVEGLAWFTQEGIPLRFRGTLRIDDAEANVEIDYRDIKTGPQPAWIFAVPPNFAGYEDRKKPTVPETNADPESVRRARESLERDQAKGNSTRF